MHQYKMILTGILITMLSGLFSGCTGTLFKNTGRFEPSTVATQNFEKFVVNDDYNYFLSGSDVYPVAIFGLKKAYTIDSDTDLWKKIEPTEKAISELVSNMQMRAWEYCSQGLHGHDILDNHGMKIGEWYSLLGLIAGIKMKEDGKVVIYPPIDNNDVKRYQGRDYPTMF